MAYVTVPKDLTHVKSKVLFGLTKRQLVCFGGALLTGGPLYFLTRNYLSNSAAALLMIFAMLPGLLFALFERHGQPLEVVIQQMIQCCFIRPKERPYQTNNAYAALVRQYQMEQADAWNQSFSVFRHFPYTVQESPIPFCRPPTSIYSSRADTGYNHFCQYPLWSNSRHQTF